MPAIKQSLTACEASFSGDILTLPEVTAKSQNLRAMGKKIVFTNGCFDILHPGHIAYLKEARSLGDILVLGLNSDTSVKRLKGASRPFSCEADRATLLTAMRMVDIVTIFDEDTPLKIIEALKPDVLVKGGDYTIDTIVGAKEVINAGGEVYSLSFVEGYSTTKLVTKVQKAK